MACMLNGAAVMDAALLLVAANEPVPMSQTAEHLAAAECLGLPVCTVQNKIDLVTRQAAAEHAEATRAFTQGTAAALKDVTPICASGGANVDAVAELLATLPAPPRRLDAPARMVIVRSFDVNKPGTEIGSLRGGVAGGAVTQGELRAGEEVEVRPGVLTRDGATGRVVGVTPLRTSVESLFAEQTPLKSAVPGGLIGVGTLLDPSLCKRDRLVGQVLGPVGTLPPVYTHLQVRCSLMRRMLGASSSHADTTSASPDADANSDAARDVGGVGVGGKTGRVAKLQPGERVLASVGAANVPGAILSVDWSGVATIELSRPVCASVGDAIALSRRVSSAAAAHWRLVGRGEITAGTAIEPAEALSCL